MMCWHHWDKWTDIEKGNIEKRLLLDPPDKLAVTGTYLIQSRICFKCGKKQIRTAKTEL